VAGVQQRNCSRAEGVGMSWHMEQHAVELSSLNLILKFSASVAVPTAGRREASQAGVSVSVAGMSRAHPCGSQTKRRSITF